ncbi:MAG: trehalase family glycosidase [Anaerolineales bacterium]
MDRTVDLFDITVTPFSDRGSRLLLCRYADRSELFLRLAERFVHLQPGLEAHRERPPFLEDFCFVDQTGNPLSFELIAQPHVLRFKTDLGEFRVCFRDHDCLAIGLPADTAAGIRFEANMAIQTDTPQGPSPKIMRDIHIQSTLPAVEEKSFTRNGSSTWEYIVQAGHDVAIDLAITHSGSDPAEPEVFSTSLNAAVKRWDRWFEAVPKVRRQYEDQYLYAWWTLANNLVSPLGYLEYEAMMPSKHKYIGAWNWDACFHAIGLRHVDPGLAKDQLRTMLRHQLADGMIPDVVFDEGVVDRIDHPIDARVTKPPVMAWAALKIFEVDEDPAFLQEIYPSLVRWNRWWFEERASEFEGLAQYNHPYSSGLDDNPLWDHGFPVVSPDLNTYLAIQMDSLGVIAEILGDDEEAGAWRRRAASTVESMVASLYDPEQGVFWALHRGQRIPELTPFNLYPLWTARLPTDIEDRLIERLTDPAEFWANFPVSTVARSTASYDPETMWRGPVWININYIFHEALRRVGRGAIASQLRERTIELVSRNKGIFEYYNPETGVPPSSAAPGFGWSAALFIDLVLQSNEE